MEIVLRGLLAILGVSSIIISLAHIVMGPDAIPGAIAVNATMDSQDRFFAALFLAYGAAVLWFLRGWRDKLREIQLLVMVLFAGGLARLVSFVVTGPPHPFYIAMTIIELVLPLAVIWLARRLADASAADAG